jgi:hypothetical protein
MALADDPGCSAAADQQAERGKLENDLHALDERLRRMLDVYEENPSAIDSGLFNHAGRLVDVQATITDVYRIMKTRVYAENSPLRADHDVWPAFLEQKEEFIGFYKSALAALEVYREVLWTYGFGKTAAESGPQHGDLRRIQQDKQVQVAERADCIEAVSDFHGKFSAMLLVLR